MNTLRLNQIINTHNFNSKKYHNKIDLTSIFKKRNVIEDDGYFEKLRYDDYNNIHFCYDFYYDYFESGGFDFEGFDINGYDQLGYNDKGYDSEGFDREGFDINNKSFDGFSSYDVYKKYLNDLERIFSK